jgi:diadenosine tetraphosphate (Ap4A) HIT family hydrolase
VSPGHVLVITHRVVPTFFDCTNAEQNSLMAMVSIVKAMRDTRLKPKPDGYNVGFNAGAAAGQTVPHVHVHVIPRYSGDMPDPRGGRLHRGQRAAPARTTLRPMTTPAGFGDAAV